MSEGPVRHCPGCGQALRFPSHIGGMLMACPVCGHRFASPFRLAGAPSVSPPPASLRPDAALQTVPAPSAAATLPDVAPRPAAPAGDAPVRPTTLAAKVAAKYAAKS